MAKFLTALGGPYGQLMHASQFINPWLNVVSWTSILALHFERITFPFSMQCTFEQAKVKIISHTYTTRASYSWVKNKRITHKICCFIKAQPKCKILPSVSKA